MTDSPGSGSPHGPTDPYGNPYPAYSDPAYAGNSPYGPYGPDGAAPPPSGPAPTEPLPPYWTQAYGQIPPGPPPAEPPPEPPKTPRWLWIAAGLVVLVVVGLVAALVITNTSSSRQTVVAPIPAMPEPSTTTTPPTTTASPTPMFPLPLPTLPTPTESTAPGGDTEPVVYEVSGTGRAINITYVDTGSVMQTEFNVVLPWRKEVSLPKPATESASVTVINVGRDITCTVTVNGVQVRQRSGAGLTICSASS
ncbi:MAG TPA: MmpS family transport accessory protein [Mycobacterium sp.]|uniref:MmpS family transport accessory protein n=1 Tax=Mycobacterium sp. TaxID=1785 RepID=UPI002C0A5175|nr:MmpS family transport accessory protein [Mycobacterium sp.]HME79339.1 MmpS family transport accessory protein [Mycobacterium sp.]